MSQPRRVRRTVIRHQQDIGIEEAYDQVDERGCPQFDEGPSRLESGAARKRQNVGSATPFRLGCLRSGCILGAEVMTIRQLSGFVLLCTPILLTGSCSSREPAVLLDSEIGNERMIFAASPTVGSLAILNLLNEKVSWAPIGVNGYVAEIETIGNQVFALVFDDSITNSPINGIYEVGLDFIGRQVLSSGGPNGRIYGIAVRDGTLFVLTERSLLEFHDGSMGFRELGSATPHPQGGGFQAFSGGLAYVSKNDELNVFSPDANKTSSSEPYPRDESRIFQFGIWGVIDQGLVVGRPGAEPLVIGHSTSPRSIRVAKVMGDLRAASVKHIDDDIFVWSIEEYPRLETHFWITNSGENEQVFLNLWISDISSIPPRYRSSMPGMMN